MAISSAAAVLMTGCEGDRPVPDARPSPRISAAGPAPLRNDVFEGRYQAALSDLRQERQRIAAAETLSALALEYFPTARFDAFVSLEHPIPMRSFLRATRPHLDVTEIHTWLAPEDAIHPSTGILSHRSLEADPSALIASTRRDALRVLRMGLRTQERVGGAASSRDDRRSLQFVEEFGVHVYGFRCSCSPTSLARLRLPVAIRLVEPAIPGEHPLWPRDRLRELIIDTRGRYGR